MPNLFRLPIVSLGTHHAPQGPVDVTPNRIQHWVNSHKKIASKGYKIPQPWGHQLKAIPVNLDRDAAKDAYKFAVSRYNGGFVDRLEKDDQTGGLVVVGEVPPGYEVEKDESGKETGRLINPTDHTVVREMSVGIGNWKDGTGEVFRDVILHAAFCTLPVDAKAAGFSATLATDSEAMFAATLATDGVEYLYTLGTGDKLMKDDDKPKNKPQDDGDDIPGASDIEIPELPAVPPPVENPPVIPNVPMAHPDAQMAADFMGLFASLGGTLPPETTPQNLLQTMKVAMTMLVSMGYKLCPPNQTSPANQEAKIDTSMTGAQMESANPMTSYMSTEIDGPVVTLSTDAAAVVDAWAADQKKSYAKAFGSLGLTEEVARQQLAYLERAKPAVDPQTKRVSFPEVKERLDLARSIAGSRQATQVRLMAPATGQHVAATLATEATPEPAPVVGKQQQPDDFKEYMSFLIEQSGLQRKTA